MWQKGWGALSSEKEGRGILPGIVHKQAGPGQRGSSGVEEHAQQPGVGKLVRVVEGGKLHRREGKTHLPCEL
jgi:hypothetical protein